MHSPGTAEGDEDRRPSLPSGSHLPSTAGVTDTQVGCDTGREYCRAFWMRHMGIQHLSQFAQFWMARQR